MSTGEPMWKPSLVMKSNEFPCCGAGCTVEFRSGGTDQYQHKFADEQTYTEMTLKIYSNERLDRESIAILTKLHAEREERVQKTEKGARVDTMAKNEVWNGSSEFKLLCQDKPCRLDVLFDYDKDMLRYRHTDGDGGVAIREFPDREYKTDVTEWVSRLHSNQKAGPYPFSTWTYVDNPQDGPRILRADGSLMAEIGESELARAEAVLSSYAPEMLNLLRRAVNDGRGGVMTQALVQKIDEHIARVISRPSTNGKITVTSLSKSEPEPWSVIPQRGAKTL